MARTWTFGRLVLAASFSAALALAAPCSLAQQTDVTTTAAPAAAPGQVNLPASQTTISTTAPVSATTTIDVGTYAGQALMWVASVFGTTIGAALTALFLRMLKNAGIVGSELLRKKLQDIIVNGINAGAQVASERLQGRARIEVKNEVVAKTVEYVKEHGADTMKQLGIDPDSNEAVSAIKARIETAINDPATPTPDILSAPKPTQPAAPAPAPAA